MQSRPPSRGLRTSGSRARGEAGRVLVVDDEPLLLRALRRTLEAQGHRVISAGSAEEAFPLLLEPELDVAVVDLRLGARSGLDVLAHARRTMPELPVIVVSGHGSIALAVRAMRLGAFDFLSKPADLHERLVEVVADAVARSRLGRVARGVESPRAIAAGPALVGASPAFQGLVRTVEGLRASESSVLLRGESGTGKEIVARALHAASPRATGPFVPVDCGALPPSLIESELFGHERGAFTGALGAPGLFRRAHGGTLFLDEVGEIPLVMQARLLRALQEREVRPVGAAGTVAVDIRVISATHRDLEAMVATGQFRADLYYRLHVVRIDLPPLRERREDLPLLVRHFLAKHRRPGSPVEGVEPEALDRLLRHDWPGNVRELENAIESALALARGPRLRAADLRIARDAAQATSPRPSTAIALSLAAYERCAIERALDETGGDATRAARLLGLGRSTLYRKLARHGIARPAERRDPGVPHAFR